MRFTYIFFVIFILLSGPMAASEYQPFSEESFSKNPLWEVSEFSYHFQETNQQSLSKPPILYGPGGDPIGGVPAGDGHLLLLAGVLSYCVYKAIRKYNNVSTYK